MSSNYLIDSYAWIEYFEASEKGKKVKEIIEKVKVATSILTIAELSDAYHRENIDFSSRLEFIQAKSVIIPLSLPIAINAGKIKTEMRKKYKNFGLVDALILSTAKQIGVTLVTGDTHFKDVKDVIFLK